MPRREWHLAIPFVLLAAMAVGAVILLHNQKIGDSPPVEIAVSQDPCPRTADGEPRRPTYYMNRADPYAGDGPHPVALVAAVTDVYGVRQYESVALPREWHGAPQLIVCEYAVTAGPSKDVCARSVILVPATYRYRVFEARTSKQVADFTRESGAGCPGIRAGAPASILESVRPEDLESALRPLVG